MSDFNDNLNYMPEEEYSGQVKSPIHFTGEGEEWRKSPIHFIDESKNTPERFVITSATANGKFVRGEMLYYKYKGIEIFTDIKNSIFVDTTRDTLMVRDYSKVVNQINPTDPEQRQYIILIYNEYESDQDTIWESIEGRTNVYDWIKQHIEMMDPKTSLILTENVPLKDALTVYQFVNHLKNSNLVPADDGFEIEDFVYYDSEEE